MKKIVGLVILSTTVLTACSSTSSNQATAESAAQSQAAVAAAQNNVIPNNGLSDTPVAQTPALETPPSMPASSMAPTTLAGDISASMSSEDKSKLSHALDKPLGKSTEWTNEMTGIQYEVVPIKKTTIEGNHFCRKYTITATKAEAKQEVSGTACVTDDGEWHVAQ